MKCQKTGMTDIQKQNGWWKKDGGEEQTEQHEVTQAQPASVREHSDEEEHQQAADQGQSAPTMVTEARQEKQVFDLFVDQQVNL